MRIKKVILTGFRCFEQHTEITFSDFTAFVGKNDIGKSTILEALDLFFNEGKGAVKVDEQDISVGIEESYYSIEVVFTDIPQEIVVDSSYTTNLKSEYLLNEDGDLDVIKRCNGKKINTFLRVLHPDNPNCSNLHQKKQNELRAIIDESAIECVNKNANSVMRKAIWNCYSDDLRLTIKEIDVSQGVDTKNIWLKLSTELPVYSLFKADRENTDGDKIVQDPLKAAVSEYLKETEVLEQLNEVAKRVEEQLKEVSDRTLSKLKEMDPDIANSLKPSIPSVEQLKWAEVFKNVSITGDDEIPINKRGSGVKRLILLNFFRAEAERRIQNSNNSSIIYAIEEPETSQHFSNQELLIDALYDLSKSNNTQVLITTHSGIMVKKLSLEDLRLVMIDETHLRRVVNTEDNVLLYRSLNEVNYIAFNEITEEYHDELYGQLEIKSWLNEFENGRKQIPYKQLDNKTGIVKNTQRTITHYIRDVMHHPENTYNEKYSKDMLRQSIKEMRTFIINKRKEES